MTLTDRSTKKELLAAYEGALAEIKRLQRDGLRAEPAGTPKETLKPGDLTTSVNDFRSWLAASLSEMATRSEELTLQYDKTWKRLEEEKAFLSNTYNIKAEAESLEALTIAKAKAKEEARRVREEADEVAAAICSTARLSRDEAEAEFRKELDRKTRAAHADLADEISTLRRAFQKDVEAKTEELNKKIAEAELMSRNAEVDVEEARARQLEAEAELEKFKKDFDDQLEKKAAAHYKNVITESNHAAAKQQYAAEAEMKVLAAKVETLEDQLADAQEEVQRARKSVEEANARVQAIATSALESAAQKQAMDTLQAAVANKSESSKR